MPETHLPTSAHVAAIDHYLPQTQCTQCGYPSCVAYAQAIADSKTSINRCPPGGDVTIQGLATLLDQSPISLDPECGSSHAPQQAFIVEAECIGCTLCIQACPVDAIIGTAKKMHTVIEDECTGCRLCVGPCPVACISMGPAEMSPSNESSLWPGLSSRRVLQARECDFTTVIDDCSNERTLIRYRMIAARCTKRFSLASNESASGDLTRN